MTERSVVRTGNGGFITMAALLLGVVSACAVTISIDHTTTYQTIVGFGGSVGGTPSNLAGTLMNDAAVSAVRIDWCEMTGHDMDATKVCYDAATVKPVVVGSCWSPPASMKDNGSVDNGGHLLA
ncbi:MAG: hypothetical protein GF331_23610, partial [Chitinivibrionales bacterium]|nr:hypothetical protein [Chitinivibrionales bacterium]